MQQPPELTTRMAQLEQAATRLQHTVSAQRSAFLMFARQLQTYGFCDLSLLTADLDQLATLQAALSPERTELLALRAEVQRLQTQIAASQREAPKPRRE